MKIFRVSKETNCKSLAGAIAEVVREKEELMINAIGANAVNQAVKAIAIARRNLEPFALDVEVKPTFKMAIVGGEEKSTIAIWVSGVDL